MFLQKIIGKILKANKEFGLFENGDRIVIGVSGGKDSLILLKAMCHIKKFLNFKIDLLAVTIDMGFSVKADVAGYDDILNICYDAKVRHEIVKTQIADIIFKFKKQKSPCSLCSKFRRGIINNFAKENGCNKIAFGHHMDDVIETFIMNLFIEGRIGCFSPYTYFSRKEISLIRPLVFVKEKQIKRAIKDLNLNIIKNVCPKDKNTYREKIKEFLREKERCDKGFKNRIFGAIRRNGMNGWKS